MDKLLFPNIVQNVFVNLTKYIVLFIIVDKVTSLMSPNQINNLHRTTSHNNLMKSSTFWWHSKCWTHISKPCKHTSINLVIEYQTILCFPFFFRTISYCSFLFWFFYWGYIYIYIYFGLMSRLMFSTMRSVSRSCGCHGDQLCLMVTGSPKAWLLCSFFSFLCDIWELVLKTQNCPAKFHMLGQAI